MNSKSTDNEVAENKDKEAPKENDWERKTLPYLFEKELIENQNKKIFLNTEFIYCNKVHPIASKFYARHHQHVPNNYLKYYEKLSQKKTNLPRLESEVYGLLQTQLSSYDLKEINFINAPKQRCPMTKFGEILISGRVTERPDFNGLRFFLR